VIGKLFAKRETVPIFPLGTVLFPGGILPLRIFEVRYVEMAKACLKDGTAFGVCLIREGTEVGAPAVPEPVGCLARIAECDVEQLGVLNVKAEGLTRFRILGTEVNRDNLVVGRIEDLHAEPLVSEAPGLDESAEFVRKVITAIGSERFALPYRFDDASWVGFRLAEILPLRMDVKQKMLELTDATLRLAVLHKFLQQQKLL
jgi:Lon protease-like protein